jgi:hypothetical protein
MAGRTYFVNFDPNYKISSELALEMTWNEKDKVWEYIPPKESVHGQEATGKSVPNNAGDSIPSS